MKNPFISHNFTSRLKIKQYEIIYTGGVFVRLLEEITYRRSRGPDWPHPSLQSDWSLHKRTQVTWQHWPIRKPDREYLTTNRITGNNPKSAGHIILSYHGTRRSTTSTETFQTCWTALSWSTWTSRVALMTKHTHYKLELGLLYGRTLQVERVLWLMLMVFPPLHPPSQRLQVNLALLQVLQCPGVLYLPSVQFLLYYPATKSPPVKNNSCGL